MFVTVPVGGAWNLDDGETTVLSESQFKIARISLEQLPGAAFISEQEVSMLCGRQAQIQQTPEHSATNTNGLMGITLNLSANCATDSARVDLTLVTEFQEPASALNRQEGFSTWRTFATSTNVAFIKDNQTLIFSRYPSKAGLPERVLVFVTPRLIDPIGQPLFQANTGETNEPVTYSTGISGTEYRSTANGISILTGGGAIAITNPPPQVINDSAN